MLTRARIYGLDHMGASLIPTDGKSGINTPVYAPINPPKSILTVLDDLGLSYDLSDKTIQADSQEKQR